MISSERLRLVLCVFIAVTCVVIGDTAGKSLTSAGVAPFFVAWTRFLLAAIFLLPLVGLTRADFRSFWNWRLLLRGALIAAGICCILTALRTEPIANVFGAFFVGPIVSFVLAVTCLGERATRARVASLLIGFTGVLLVVKPGFGATAGMGFAVAAGVFYGGYLAMTRPLAGQYQPQVLLSSQLLIGSILLAPAGLSVPLPSFDIWIWALIGLSALGSAVGNYLLVLANRSAEASVIAPLVYTQLISATVIGGLVFREWPDTLTLFGLSLILLSGLGVLLVKKA